MAFVTIPAAAFLLIAGLGFLSGLVGIAVPFCLLGGLAILLGLGIPKATQSIGHLRFVLSTFAIGLVFLLGGSATLYWKSETTYSSGYGYDFELLGWAIICLSYAIAGVCYMLAALLAIRLEPRERKGLATRPHWMD